MFKNIGFFQFVSNYAHPIEELRTALAADCRRQSLIVLPEAFNIGQPYSGNGSCDFSGTILSELSVLSQSFHSTFVSGLIIRRCILGRLYRSPPYSSVYLIDSCHQILMCHKLNDDKSGKYSPCRIDECDIRNPVVLDDTCLAALICRDCNIENHADVKRHKALNCRIAEADRPYNIMCIPAWMSRASGFQGDAIASNWPKSDVILANSRPDQTSCESFISSGGSIKKRSVVGEGNKIVVWPD
jgi:hypothetical protein